MFASKTNGLVLDCASQVGGVSPSTVTLTDHSRYKGSLGLTNVVWSQQPSKVWTAAFNSNSYAQLAALSSRQANFTSESFTALAWMYSTSIGSAQYIVCQGVTDADGWGIFVFANNLSLRLSQGGSHTDISAVDGFGYSRWQLVGVTRTGNTGQFYNNGLAVTTIGGGGLVNAVSVNSGNKLLIGIADGEVLNGLTGSLSKIRIFSYALTPPAIRSIFERERRLFGV